MSSVLDLKTGDLINPPPMPDEIDMSVTNVLRVRNLCMNFDRVLARTVLEAIFSHEEIFNHEGLQRPPGGGEHGWDPHNIETIMMEAIAETCKADAWSISSECCKIIESIAEDLPEPPDMVVPSSTIPSSYGWVYLNNGLEDHPRRKEMVRYHALSWGLVAMADWGEGVAYGIIITPWVWTQQTGLACLPLGPSVFPLDVNFSKFHARLGWDEGKFITWGDSRVWLLKFLLASFAWSAGEANRDIVPLKRPQRRREAREGRETSELLVVRLRHYSASERAGNGEEGTVRTSAHYRSGHWRWARIGRRDRDDTRLTWVRPHIVRPDLLGDKELLPEKKQKVIQVDR